ncbi:hypothetical protein [Serratia sp. SRS-8-S-2018]|nr:hypothetical protein [Serratia sp. SRS-8-S-2018]
MLAQIISERQMSDRLFTSSNKCMHVMRAFAVSLDVVTPAGNAVLARGVYPMSRILSFKLSNAGRLSTSSNISIVGIVMMRADIFHSNNDDRAWFPMAHTCRYWPKNPLLF